jgi:hypothetical protein
MEEDALQYINIVTSTIITKFKRKMWRDATENKRKLNYCKEIISTKLEDHNYIFNVVNTIRKINIANIRTNYNELHSEIGHWIRPKNY